MKGDLSAVGRPLGIEGTHGRIGELKALGAVGAAADEGAFGEFDVCHPLAIGGEDDVIGRDRLRVGKELASGGVVADESAAELFTDDEETLAIFAGDRKIKGEGSVGELDG